MSYFGLNLGYLGPSDCFKLGVVDGRMNPLFTLRTVTDFSNANTASIGAGNVTAISDGTLPNANAMWDYYMQGVAKGQADRKILHQGP